MQMQPRLHLKSPPPGSDGKFALTSDNIEWHLRLIPPMKESKFDRILRYVQMQQQNVAAMADTVHQWDIDNSLLMSGQIPYDCDPATAAAGAGYMDTSGRAMEHMTAPQQYHQQFMHAGPLHASHHINSSTAAPIQMPPGAMGQTATPTYPGALLSPAVPAFNANSPLPPLPTLSNDPANHASATERVQREGGPANNEEDDNTPLASINIVASPRQHASKTQPAFQPNNLSTAVGGSIEKYMSHPLDTPLPNPASPTNAARMSVMSIQTNVADNLNSDQQELSRSHSLSVHESGYRASPLARSPTIQDTGAQHLSINTGPGRHPSFPAVPINNRPSLEAITPRTLKVPSSIHDQQNESSDNNADGDKPLAVIAAGAVRDAGNGDNEDDDDDDEPLHKQLHTAKIAVTSSKYEAAVSDGSGNSVEHAVGEPTPNLDPAFASSRVEGAGAGAAGLQPDPIRVGNSNHTQLETPLNEDRPQKSDAPSESAHSGSDSDTESYVPLRVVNQISNNDNGDTSADEDSSAEDQLAHQKELGAYNQNVQLPEDDDDQPLMNLTRHLSQTRGAQLTVDTQKEIAVSGIDGADAAATDDDDDDQPLSNLLFSTTPSGNDVGSLPLPLPRRLTDPHSTLDADGVINETVATPMRTSIGDRPTSPPIASGIVRKHSLLSRSFQLHGQSLGKADVHDTGDDFQDAERNVPAKQPATLNKQRSSLSGYSLPVSTAAAAMSPNHTGSLPRLVRISQDLQIPASGSAQHSPHSPRQQSIGFDRHAAIAENCYEDDAHAEENENSNTGASGVEDFGYGVAKDVDDIIDPAQLHNGGRPWAENRVYSASASSLTGIRRAMRGSTLGQSLTDELHKLREDLARSRKEDERSDRRSWQVGTSVDVLKPWIQNESTKSETALPQKFADAREPGRRSTSRLREIDSTDKAHTELVNLPTDWECSSKPRPMTAYQPRTSR
ncbi:hypothetical protein GGI12_000866, partial [Dipsacomyces acuminosporus]